MTHQEILDENKVKGALARAEKDGNAKMIDWCERQLKCFEAYRRAE